MHEAAHRVAGRDVLAARDFVAPVDTLTLIIWGEQDIALDLPSAMSAICASNGCRVSLIGRRRTRYKR